MNKLLYFIILICLSFYSCNMKADNNSIEKWKQEIMETEKSFAKMVREEGLHKAFMAYAAEDAVLREVKEETGLRGKIIRKGKVFEVTDKWGRWVIMTFLVEVASTEISIDRREHSEAVWIKPENIDKYDLVAGVKKDLKVLQLL